MINKRLLIKNLLAYHGENSFYDKKVKLDLYHKEGKAKFLKHVCALANSNPLNPCYIVVGIDDLTNAFKGVEFYDDAKFQNLINAYLENPPRVIYENISFSELGDDLVIGLVTINSSGEVCSLAKNIWKYTRGMSFKREGSISMPTYVYELENREKPEVISILKSASNDLASTLDTVVSFMNRRQDGLHAQYCVFKEQYVVCWSGRLKQKELQKYYSRVDIELVNEQVRLFYSAYDEVQITFDNEKFIILEYLHLGLGNNRKYYPWEQQTISFNGTGSYSINSQMVFEPPVFDKPVLYHLYNANLAILSKLQNNLTLTSQEQKDLLSLPEILLLCALNHVGEAVLNLEASKEFLRPYQKAYTSFKQVMRVLRKLKYNT